MEQEDYSKIYEYESSGKVYAGEKACISMTSWKARINTCAKTIFSLLQQCPGFHIVLVLSKDEFPLMEKELPENLMLFVENNLIELFWIRPNLKSFKKVLFTMDKYRDVPVISADDDCIYTCNYAKELYNKFKKQQSNGIYYVEQSCGTGYGALFTPFLFNKHGLLNLNEKIIYTNNDDVYYFELVKKMKYKFIYCREIRKPFFHDSTKPLSAERTTSLNSFAHNLVAKSLKL